MNVREVVLTASRANDLWKCQSLHMARWLLRRGTDGGSDALAIGTAAHERFARAVQGAVGPWVWDVEAELAVTQASRGRVVSDKARREARVVGKWMELWWKEGERPWEEVELVEKAVRAQVAVIEHEGEPVRVWVQGKLDAFVRGAGPYVGAWWVWEIKTRAFEYANNVRALREYVLEKRRSWQVLWYTWLARRAFPDRRIDGVLMFIVDKAPHECKDGRIRELREAVHVEFLPIDDTTIQVALDEAVLAARAVLAQEDVLARLQWDPSLSPYRLPAPQTGRGHACRTVYGSCPLRPVCDGEAPLVEPFLFGEVDPWEHYKANELVVVAG